MLCCLLPTAQISIWDSSTPHAPPVPSPAAPQPSQCPSCTLLSLSLSCDLSTFPGFCALLSRALRSLGALAIRYLVGSDDGLVLETQHLSPCLVCPPDPDTFGKQTCSLPVFLHRGVHARLGATPPSLSLSPIIIWEGSFASFKGLPPRPSFLPQDTCSCSYLSAINPERSGGSHPTYVPSQGRLDSLSETEKIFRRVHDSLWLQEHIPDPFQPLLASPQPILGSSHT